MTVFTLQGSQRRATQPFTMSARMASERLFTCRLLFSKRIFPVFTQQTAQSFK